MYRGFSRRCCGSSSRECRPWHDDPGALAVAELGEGSQVAAAADPFTSKAISVDELVLSVLTVRTHIQRAMTKIAARDRAQLVVIAYRTGLVRPPG
ncbi:response regulator transcription factor [Streptomyces sp. NPDC048710]|uniref:response regulator transcription factor n=1 Tax=Streptomyces sp. NPDC048710 TaxID=3365586 RepID=UPI00371BD710